MKKSSVTLSLASMSVPNPCQLHRQYYTGAALNRDKNLVICGTPQKHYHQLQKENVSKSEYYWMLSEEVHSLLLPVFPFPLCS